MEIPWQLHLRLCPCSFRGGTRWPDRKDSDKIWLFAGSAARHVEPLLWITTRLGDLAPVGGA